MIPVKIKTRTNETLVGIGPTLEPSTSKEHVEAVLLALSEHLEKKVREIDIHFECIANDGQIVYRYQPKLREHVNQTPDNTRVWLEILRVDLELARVKELMKSIRLEHTRVWKEWSKVQHSV